MENSKVIRIEAWLRAKVALKLEEEIKNILINQEPRQESDTQKTWDDDWISDNDDLIRDGNELVSYMEDENRVSLIFYDGKKTTHLEIFVDGDGKLQTKKTTS
jgi:hypothetical protein